MPSASSPQKTIIHPQPRSPASVHADTIYRTRVNRAYCKERGIRLSGKPLGRVPKQTEQNRELLKARKKQMLSDEHARIPVEGKFGNAKRKGTLGRIMAKLAKTSESVIHVGIVVLNLDTWLRAVIFGLLNWLEERVRWQQMAPEASSARVYRNPVIGNAP